MYLLFQLIPIGLGIFTGSVAKKKLAPGASWGVVSTDIKVLIVFTILISPLVGGFTLYYVLRAQFPLLAKRSNLISFVIAGVWLVAFFVAYPIIIGQITA